MAKPKRKGQDALRYAAEMRAAIIALFNRNDPSNYIVTSAKVAEELGRDRRDVAYYLKALVESGQLADAGRIGREYLFRRNGQLNPAHADTSEPTTITHAPRKAHKDAQREVELVLDGVVIVVGKNPATGRIRVTIE